MKTAVLLSGGQDSIALAFWLRPALAITLDYGQLPADAEIRASSAVCGAMGLTHRIVRIDCSALGSGDLTPGAPLAMAPVPEWWPYRNQLLVTLGGSSALSAGVDTIALGIVSTDGSHRDGTMEFVEKISDLMGMQEGGLQVTAPAIRMTSTELIRISGVPDDILYWAHSCHRGSLACGQCRGCIKHKNVMFELGRDPF